VKKLITLLTLLACLITFPAYAADSVSEAIVTDYEGGDGTHWRDIYWTWNSPSASSETKTGGYVNNQTGRVWKIVAIPSVADAPDASYDVTIPVSTGGRDAITGEGANLPAAASGANDISPLNDVGDRPVLLNESIYFSISGHNAADTASGGFHLILEVWEKD
jgi:hypothetical protein